MKIMIRGVRGSIPTTGPDTAFYGGNTSCAVVEEGDCMLVLDGGSGMQKFNLLRDTPIKKIDILLSHLHLDHIQGLGFFNPFFDPTLEVNIWGPASTSSLHARLSRYLSPPLFPVLLRDLPCKLTLHDIGNSSFTIGHFQIESRYVIHPGPTVGYRIKGRNSVFTYIPDHEPVLGAAAFSPDKKWISGMDLAQDADLLWHDAQYSALEYQYRCGWGHSSMDDAARFAELAGVKRLLLAHHDPAHSDTQLNELLDDLKRRSKFSFECELATEGTMIELP
ncbi:MAG: MBL fold metallo-hydrolase [Chitinophagaceae bacterium]